MAIKIYDNFYSVIIKVDSIMRIYGENGFEAFLKEFFPEPPKKKKRVEKRKHKGLFSKSRPIQEDVDNKEEYTLNDYFYMHCAERFNDVTGVCGHDGNLAYMSFSREENMSACCERLDQKGFYGYKSVIYVDDVDYVIFEKNGFPISIQWLETIEEDKGSDLTSPTHVYAVSPFKLPMHPMSFPSIQGGIRYETELQWNLGQKYIQNKDFNRFRELCDVSLIYANCNIGWRITESVDDWFRAYDTSIDLSKLSGDMEYKLLSILGDCICTRNFIPLYRFLDDTPICRFSMDEAERPVSKYDLTVKLTKLFQKLEHKPHYSVRFEPKTNRYIGLIRGQEIKEIDIEVCLNKIQTFWLVEKRLYILRKEDIILNQIVKEWNQGSPLYIVRYLAEDFKYTLCGNEEIFGNHVLSKRQYIRWLKARFESIIKHDLQFYAEPKSDGILIHIGKSLLHGDLIFVKMEIVDGQILNAQELQVPLTFSKNTNDLKEQKQLLDDYHYDMIIRQLKTEDGYAEFTPDDIIEAKAKEKFKRLYGYDYKSL